MGTEKEGRELKTGRVAASRGGKNAYNTRKDFSDGKKKVAHRGGGKRIGGGKKNGLNFLRGT